MSDIELIRELRGLEGDKALIKHAVSSKQEEMKNLLNNGMGDDIKAVLSGEKTIKIPKMEKKKFKVKLFFKKLFRKF